MPFLLKCRHVTAGYKSHPTTKNKKGKTAMPQYKNNPTKSNTERASVPGSRASITIEASLAIPIFLFAVLCLIYTMEIQTLQTQIRFAVENAAKEEAAQISVIPVLNTGRLKQNIVDQIGKDRLDHSIIVNGSEGIRCNQSYLSVFNDEIHVKAKYFIQLPFPEFTRIKMPLHQEIVVKAWTGKKNKNKEQDANEIVYITKYGSVYHESAACTYLNPKISYVSYKEVGKLRNRYGEKYKQCTKCSYCKPISGVYVSEQGNKYHNSLNCSGLKRSIYTIKKSEIGHRKGCSKCVH